MRYANVAAIAISILMLVAGFFFRTPSADATSTGAIPAPTLVINAPPIPPIPVNDFDECLPNNMGLAEKPCKGYRLPETFNQAKVNKYAEKYWRQCNYNRNYDPADPTTKVPGNFRCIFQSAILACSAYVKVQNEIGGLPGMPWIPTAIKIQGSTTGDMKCHYCWQGETKDATNFDGKKYCSANGGFIIGLEDPALFSVYPDVPYFCANIGINGPYQNIPDDFSACGQMYTQGVSGANFTETQKVNIRALNRTHFTSIGQNTGPSQNRSDLAGFCFSKPPSGCAPTIDNGNGTCTEPSTALQANQVQVHHIVPRKAGTSCPCGTNSPKNAAVISAKLNSYFSNKDLTTLTMGCGMQGADEQEVINSLGAYTVFNVMVYHMNRLPRYDVSLIKLKNPVLIKKVVVRKTKKVKPKNKRRK